MLQGILKVSAKPASARCKLCMSTFSVTFNGTGVACSPTPPYWEGRCARSTLTNRESCPTGAAPSSPLTSTRNSIPGLLCTGSSLTSGRSHGRPAVPTTERKSCRLISRLPLLTILSDRDKPEPLVVLLWLPFSKKTEGKLSNRMGKKAKTLCFTCYVQSQFGYFGHLVEFGQTS